MTETELATGVDIDQVLPPLVFPQYSTIAQYFREDSLRGRIFRESARRVRDEKLQSKAPGADARALARVAKFGVFLVKENIEGTLHIVNEVDKVEFTKEDHDNVVYGAFTKLGECGLSGVTSLDELQGVNLNDPRVTFETVKARFKHRAEKAPPGEVLLTTKAWRWVEVPKIGDNSVHNHLLAAFARHCGNASYRTGDRLIYLATSGKRSVHLATMMIRNKKILEIKGTGNQKPTEEAHEGIVSFIIHLGKEVNGRGSGYLPENDFHASDLKPALFEKLKAGRPDLINSL